MRANGILQLSSMDFFQGPSESVKDQLVTTDLPENLDSLIALAIKIDKRLSAGSHVTSPGMEKQLRAMHVRLQPALLL